MRVLAVKYPEDDDVQTMCAEALMNLHPWDHWKENGDPQPWTPEILGLPYKVLLRQALPWTGLKKPGNGQILN